MVFPFLRCIILPCLLLFTGHIQRPAVPAMLWQGTTQGTLFRSQPRADQGLPKLHQRIELSPSKPSGWTFFWGGTPLLRELYTFGGFRIAELFMYGTIAAGSHNTSRSKRAKTQPFNSPWNISSSHEVALAHAWTYIFSIDSEHQARRVI